VPVGRAAFDFPAMTYLSERPGDRIPYITTVSNRPLDARQPFTYREPDDPWLREMRRAPAPDASSRTAAAGSVSPANSMSPATSRSAPADLYVSSGHLRSGVVLIGDAFAATCTVTAPDRTRCSPDVERLCRVHIPKWLASEGWARRRIAAFYDGPVKQACDAWSGRQGLEFQIGVDRPRPLMERARWARFFFVVRRRLNDG
jgi:hypothetical protein